MALFSSLPVIPCGMLMGIPCVLMWPMMVAAVWEPTGGSSGYGGLRLYDG